ncbi:MAG: M28 family peptidase [Terriglobales bacterium]
MPAATPAAAPAAAQRVDPQRAMRYVREVVGFGSRPPGSRGHRRLEAYLRTQLKGDNLEEDAFTASTPADDLPMRNFIAKYPGTKHGVIVIASHYDTSLPLKNFVGANDGGSSTGLLLELAHHLRGKKRDGYSVWLVWFDGEEAVREWSSTDSLYGSRHLAARWQKDGTLRKLKAFVLLDMVGDKELNIDRDQNSTPWLLDLVAQAAARLNYQAHFFQRGVNIEDDHVPFARAGVPVVDLIDFEYGYGNVFHHTSDDTLDKLNPRSLEVVGNVVLETLRLLDAK